MRFENKIVVITGAGGIGAECARKFVAEGASVALLDLKEEIIRKAIEIK